MTWVIHKSMNNSGDLGYSRVKLAANARRRHMKLWFTTANVPQRSRCGEIGSPEGEKMPTYNEYFTLLSCCDYGVGIFYE